jgi:hypothetical protein
VKEENGRKDDYDEEIRRGVNREKAISGKQQKKKISLGLQW